MELETKNALAVCISLENEDTLSVSKYYARRFKTIMNLRHLFDASVDIESQQLCVKDVGASEMRNLEFRLNQLNIEDPEFVYVEFWSDEKGHEHPQFKEIGDYLRLKFKRAEIFITQNH